MSYTITRCYAAFNPALERVEYFYHDSRFDRPKQAEAYLDAEYKFLEGQQGYRQLAVEVEGLRWAQTLVSPIGDSVTFIVRADQVVPPALRDDLPF